MTETRWLDSPCDQFEDQLKGLARNYSFENRRREELGLDPVDHLLWHQKNRRDHESCLAVLNDGSLVGWLELSRNQIHSSHFDQPVFTAGWELIKNNNNEIRRLQLEKLTEKYSGSRLYLQQPSDNTEALDLYERRTNLEPAGREIYLGRLLDAPPSAPESRPGKLRSTRKENLKQSELREIARQYEKSRFHTSCVFPDQVAKKIFENWLTAASRKQRNRLYGLRDSARLVGLIVARILPEDFPARRRPGTISFIYVHPDYRRQNLGSFLLATGEKILANNGVNYTELKVNSQNEAAVEFYRGQGYREVTRRFHYVQPPAENTP